MTELDISNCQTIVFSSSLMKDRLKKARLLFGDKMLKRILCFSLFLLGSRRNKIAEILNLHGNTVRSMLKTILKDGYPALLDRREKSIKIPEMPVSKTQPEDLVLINEQDGAYHISINGCQVSIPVQNKLQFKVLLLGLTQNNLLTKTEAGKLLEISSSHVGYLCRQVLENDITVLVDKREGQQKDYVFTPELKSELIVQFAANAAQGKPTSSPVLASDIQQRTSHKLSERGIRYHLSNLGIKGKTALIRELIGLKKTL